MESDALPKTEIKITYHAPKFFHRVIANLIDILLFALSFFCLFLSLRWIIQSTPHFNDVNSKMNQIKIDSGLYIENSKGEIRDVITYVGLVDLDSYAKVVYARNSIEQFLSYCEEVCDKDTAKEIKNSYDEHRLDDNLKDKNNEPYFIKNDDSIVIKNTDCKATNIEYFNNFYTPFIDDVLQGYLLTSVPNYYDYTKYMSNMLFYIELPISYLVSGILIYFVPTLIFKRGRKTFGKAIYHIGLVDARMLNPTFAWSFARFAMFYFLELILSMFTFGIPYLVSFSLMAFSKHRQGFPDYMLGLREVDTSDHKIFFDYDEITLDELKHSKTPVNFKIRDEI